VLIKTQFLGFERVFIIAAKIQRKGKTYT